jgi:uncharacterized protein YjbI with pentapeptide repeats
MDVSELLARYAVGERDFSGFNLNNADLSGADLYEANLNGADLIGANLNGADLIGANLIGANLNGADLCEANLTVANLYDANLCDAKLSCANLNGANLCEANLNSANLSGANLSSAYLRGADLGGANLSGANLIGADLTAADLSCAKLIGANLVGADLIFADLIGAKLISANLTGVNLTGANLYKADLTNANLDEAKIDGTILAREKVSEELQRKNQALTERVRRLEEELEKQKLTQDSIQPSNQGIKAPHQWNGFYFRSKTEIKIAEALDRAGVLFYPNNKARLNQAEFRVNKESDFLIFQAGKFGILEVDGRPYHQTAADDHERDRLFKRHGIRVIERFDSKRCWDEPDKVVQEFLELLSQA